MQDKFYFSLNGRVNLQLKYYLIKLKSQFFVFKSSVFLFLVLIILSDGCTFLSPTVTKSMYYHFYQIRQFSVHLCLDTMASMAATAVMVTMSRTLLSKSVK